MNCPKTPIKAPKKCLICNAKYSGGHCLRSQRMREGMRVFYKCGASMSVTTLDKECAVYQILFKNCEHALKEALKEAEKE